jgi:hypothetical protein
MSLINRWSRLSIRMPLARANQSFVNIYSFGNLVTILTQYSNILDKVFHNSMLWKRKVKVTYLLYLRVVLILTMVQSRPHHLTHQWSQINTFVSWITFITILISRVYMFTFKCFTFYTIIQWNCCKHFSQICPVETYSRNRQRKLIRYRPYNSAVKTGLLQGAKFDNKNCFAAGATISAANATSLQPTCFRQRMLIRYRQLSSSSKSQFRCKLNNFGSQC